jgi:hypothetical protein
MSAIESRIQSQFNLEAQQLLLVAPNARIKVEGQFRYLASWKIKSSFGHPDAAATKAVRRTFEITAEKGCLELEIDQIWRSFNQAVDHLVQLVPTDSRRSFSLTVTYQINDQSLIQSRLNGIYDQSQ